jgi:hypothetical protein
MYIYVFMNIYRTALSMTISTYDAQVFYVFVLGVSASIAVGVLLIYHGHLCLTNQTTIECYLNVYEREDAKVCVYVNIYAYIHVYRNLYIHVHICITFRYIKNKNINQTTVECHLNVYEREDAKVNVKLCACIFLYFLYI